MGFPTDPNGEFYEQEIPAEYLRFDSRVTDPEMFLNARDRQVFAKNHNMQMARRVRQMLFTMSLTRDENNDGSTSGGPRDMAISLPRTVNSDRTSGYRLLDKVPVALPTHAKSCTFVVFGARVPPTISPLN